MTIRCGTARRLGLSYDPLCAYPQRYVVSTADTEVDTNDWDLTGGARLLPMPGSVWFPQKPGPMRARRWLVNGGRRSKVGAR